MNKKKQHVSGREVNFINYNERKDLQTVVDKQEGVYLGHPSTAMLKDGKTIFMVYPKSHGFGQIVMKKSEDGGRLMKTSVLFRKLGFCQKKKKNHQ